MTLTTHDLCFRYPTSESHEFTLAQLNFTLSPGESVALLGPSGSGKSTLAQLLNGLFLPTRGYISLDGKRVLNQSSPLRALRRQVGMVFQFPEMQIFEASVAEEIAFAARQWGLPTASLPARVSAALRSVGLDSEAYLTRDPLKLSGGESRLLTIASLLVVEPAWLILDEPTLGLDYDHLQKIKSLLWRRQQAGGGVMLISHDLDLALEVCPRALVLKAGHLVYDGETPTLLTSAELESQFGLAATPRMQLWQQLRSTYPQALPPDSRNLEDWFAQITPEARRQIQSLLAGSSGQVFSSR